MVGGWAVLYVGVFLRPVGDEPFFLFLQYRPPTGAWEYHRPTAALLCPLLPYVLLLHCRTAAGRVIIFVLQNLHTEDDTLLPYVLLLHCRIAAVLSFLFCKTYIQRMIPLLPHVRRHCRTALLLFGSFSTQYRGYSTNLFLSAIPAGNCHVSGVPLVLCNTVG